MRSSLQPSSGPARLALGCWTAAALLAAIVGCGDSRPPVEFKLNLQDLLQNIPSHDPDMFRVTGDEESEEEREAKKSNIARLRLTSTILLAAFGTPDEPYLFEEVRWNAEEQTGLDLKKINLAAGPVQALDGDPFARQRGLYREHCAHCHGISGDGAGPTAAFLDPYPRDYRQGTFKFKSTSFSKKPTRADLRRTVAEGIPGTAMPSFGLLPSDEIDALVEYVIYLAVRGETEESLGITLFMDEDDVKPERTVIVEEHLQPVVDQWNEAGQFVVQPPPHPPVDTPRQLAESIEKGRLLFQTKEAQCLQCHGPTGLGDGWVVGKEDPYDDWNKAKRPEDSERWLLPRQELQPRNLRLGIYRGGRRPVDLYRRIHAGIPGAQMPGIGPDEGKPEALKPEQIWNLVDYVRSLPYESESESQSPRVTLHKPRN